MVKPPKFRDPWGVGLLCLEGFNEAPNTPFSPSDLAARLSAELTK
jgi:hypothetical protein